jgi:hypothetical protein
MAKGRCLRHNLTLLLTMSADGVDQARLPILARPPLLAPAATVSSALLPEKTIDGATKAAYKRSHSKHRKSCNSNTLGLEL